MLTIGQFARLHRDDRGSVRSEPTTTESCGCQEQMRVVDNPLDRLMPNRLSEDSRGADPAANLRLVGKPGTMLAARSFSD